MGDFTGQDITNTAWVFATVGRPHIQLFTALAMAAQQRLGNFNAQCITSTAQAFGMASHRDVQLFEALARMAARHVDEF